MAIRRTSAADRTSAPKATNPRARALASVIALVDKATKNGRPPTANLDVLDADRYQTPRGRAVSIDVDNSDAPRGDYLSFCRVMVDAQHKELFVQHNVYGNIGPFKLPSGVSVSALLDDGKPLKKGRTRYEKQLGLLTPVIKKGMPDALESGRVQLKFQRGAFRAPDGEKLEHHYVRDHFPGIPGGALMLGEKSFWVEMIPGVSGDCYGPFKLPKGFDRSILLADDEEPAPRRPSDSYDDGDRRPAVLIGGDSSHYRPTPMVDSGSGVWPAGPAWLGGRGSS